MLPVLVQLTFILRNYLSYSLFPHILHILLIFSWSIVFLMFCVLSACSCAVIIFPSVSFFHSTCSRLFTSNLTSCYKKNIMEYFIPIRFSSLKLDFLFFTLGYYSLASYLTQQCFFTITHLFSEAVDVTIHCIIYTD